MILSVDSSAVTASVALTDGDKVIKSELSKSSYNLDNGESNNNSTPEIINSKIVEEFLEI